MFFSARDAFFVFLRVYLQRPLILRRVALLTNDRKTREQRCRVGLSSCSPGARRYMSEAGYRDTSGKWLARPSRPLVEYGRSDGPPAGAATNAKAEAVRKRGTKTNEIASVLFVRESRLVEVRWTNLLYIL